MKLNKDLSVCLWTKKDLIKLKKNISKLKNKFIPVNRPKVFPNDIKNVVKALKKIGSQEMVLMLKNLNLILQNFIKKDMQFLLAMEQPLLK